MKRPFILDIYGHYGNEKIKKRIDDFFNKHPKLKSKVNFKGYANKSKKYKALSTADAFILPSHMEGCPNSVVEATASGCFVIASDVGAISEIVLNGINAILIEPKNVSDLKNAINAFYENNKIFIENSINSKTNIESKCEISFIKSKFHEILVS